MSRSAMTLRARTGQDGTPRWWRSRVGSLARCLTGVAGLWLGVCALSASAVAGPDLRFRGYASSDVRVVPDRAVSFERLEGILSGRASLRLSEHVGAVADLRFIFTERSELEGLDGLFQREMIDPWRLESDALFVEFYDVGIDGLDFRIGRQQLVWGSADKFHPTSNLNPLDVEDPSLFGAVIANEMITMRFQPELGDDDEDEPVFDELAFEFVLVPFFKPAQLPPSAQLGFTDQDEMARRADTPLLLDLVAQQQALLAQGWTFDYQPEVVLPERNLRNAMYGARMSFRLLSVDVGLSYFRGFDDFPRAENIVSTVEGTHADNLIRLTYPRVHVIGVDTATSIPWLDGLGLWAEVGLTLHDDLRRSIETGPIIGVNEVETEVPGGHFIKATVGMDYTPLPWWYVNIQYLHGFLDEFGADRLEDYLVAGMDFKAFQERLLIRLFGIVNFQDGSFVLYPQLVITPFSGGELSVGAFLYSALLPDPDPNKKFESPAAGDSTVFFKAKASW